MTCLAFLPLDDRPVNYDMPRELAALAGIKMLLPDRDMLGNPWRPSRHAELAAWLVKCASRADALLVALDTLAYGGLIPSRTSTEPVAEVLERLSLLKHLKLLHPNLLILGYNIILRICRNDSAEEEKEYWGTYGSRMFRLSYLEHKTDLGEASRAEEQERRRLRREIPDEVYEDYLQGRQRNHAVNLAMLDWLAEGVFDYLLFPQDDTAEYGWNIAEARRLQGLIRQRGLSERAISYPGADETASLLLARYACQLAGFRPQVWPRTSSQASSRVITSYEDRPIHELLKAHLAPLEGSIAESPEQADILLFINAPAERQGEAALQLLVDRVMEDPSLCNSIAKDDEGYRVTRREMISPYRSVEELLRSMGRSLSRSAPVALADVAFVNGADLFLGQGLMRSGLAPRLSAYAGWNTAGNTLGTVLAHASLVCLMQRSIPSPEQKAAHLAFLFRRYVDDYLYQSVVRTELAYEDLPALSLAPSMERLPDEKIAEVEKRLQKRLSAATQELRSQFLKTGMVRNIQARNFHLPWQRLFEIGFEVDVELS